MRPLAIQRPLRMTLTGTKTTPPIPKRTPTGTTITAMRRMVTTSLPLIRLRTLIAMMTATPMIMPIKRPLLRLMPNTTTTTVMPRQLRRLPPVERLSPLRRQLKSHRSGATPAMHRSRT